MKQRLKRTLSQRQKSNIVDAGRVPSAVLIPIYHRQGQYYILFTKRTEKVKDHKGQISFPGGAYEEQDGVLVNTALRESAEEIGLAAEAIELLGELDDFPTASSGYIVSPFAAFIPWPYSFKTDPIEVDRLIEVPISALLEQDGSPEENADLDGELVTTYSYHYQGEVIWGATARILNQFLGIWSRATENAGE